MTWRLRASSPENDIDLRFGNGTHIVGCSKDADLVVKDPTVSRRHARLEVTERGITIVDLDSTNGTVVNGKRIREPVFIVEPCPVKLGGMKMSLEPISNREIRNQQLDDAQSSGESVLLGPATVGFLRSAGEEVTYQAGEIVVRRGEQQEYFYVVIEGVVELSIGESEARRPPLARLGEGGIFGAESVFAKEGAAVDSIAVTDVRLLRYPAASLPSALQESESPGTSTRSWPTPSISSGTRK